MLTEDLKKKLGGAASEEEVKTILAETKQNVEDAGVILDDAELDQVASGLSFTPASQTTYITSSNFPLIFYRPKTIRKRLVF